MEPLEARWLLASDAFLASGLIERLSFPAGAIATVGETDSYQVQLDAGQTFSVWIDPLELLAPLITIVGPTGTVGSALAGAGQTAAASALAAAVSGTYTIFVAGIGGSTGGYDLAGLLNALPEPESIGGAANDAPAVANTLVPSAISWGAAGADRLGAVGRLDAAGAGDYFSFTLGDGQSASLALSTDHHTAIAELVSAAGITLARGIAAENADQAILHFVDATSDGAAEQYFVRIVDSASQPGDEYGLVVTRGVDFEIEPNRLPAAGQATTGVLGRIAPTPVSGVSLLSEFAGMDSLDNPGGLEPPDTHMAVGRNHVIETVNTALTIYRKDGTIAVGPTQFASFFTPSILAGDGFLFDPVVAYDELADRFVVAILSAATGNSQESDLLYAVSNSSDPTQGFSEQHRINFGGVSPNLFADYPKIGFNADAHVFTVNMFGASFVNVDVLVVDKSTVLDGNTATFQSRIHHRSSSSFTMAVATMHGSQPGDPMWFVEESGFGGTRNNVRVVRMTNVLSAAPTFNDFLMSVPTYVSGNLPSADQPGGGKFTTNDARVLNAEFREGRLAAVHTVGDGGRTVVRWYDFDVSQATPALIQSGTVDGGPGASTYFPSIAIGPLGELGLTYMQSSAAEHVSMYVTGQAPGSTPGTMSAPVRVKAGDEAYPGGRGGDYSGIGVDPATGSFWAANEVSLAGAPNPFWSTWIGQFTVAPLVDEDWYVVYASAGDAVALRTITPLDGPLRADNRLNPILELFDPSGTLVAQDDDSADGRNALIQFTALATGAYRLKATTPTSSDGVYHLVVAGATGSAPAPSVVAMTPASGSVLPAFPGSIRLTFSEGMLLSSVAAADVSIGGLPATSATIVNGRTIDFGVDPLAFAGDRTYQVVVAGGAVADLKGRGVSAFAGEFRVDTTGPVLIDTKWNDLPFPASGAFAPGPLTFAGVFNEDLFTISSARRGLRTPGSDDVRLVESITGVSYSPLSVAYEASTFTFTAQFGALPEGNYQLRLVSGNGAFEDGVGNDLDGEPGATIDGAPTGDGAPGGDYTIALAVDVGPGAAPIKAFERLQPLGAQVFASLGNHGAINGIGDLDPFMFDAIASELLSVRVTPVSAAATLVVEVNGALFSAPGAGAPVVLDSLSLAVGTTQLVHIAADAATPYFLDVVLNANAGALLEAGAPYVMESVAAGTYGQTLFRAFGAATGAAGGLVLTKRSDGRGFFDISPTGTALSLSDDGETTIMTTVGNALIPAGPVTVANNGGILAGGGGNLPAGNSPLPVVGMPAALLPYWDDIDSGAGNVYWQELSIGGVRTLIVQWDRRPLYPGRGAGTFQVQLFETGPTLARFAYRDVDFSVPDSFGAGATIGVQRNDGDAVQFSFNERSLNNNDVINITQDAGVVDVDEFTFTLQPGTVGSRVDVLLAGQGADLGGGLLELIDPQGVVVATGGPGGVANGGIDQAMLGYVPALAGEYKIRLAAVQTADYVLTVGAGLALDVGPAESQGAARSLDGYASAMGYLAATGVPRFVQRSDAGAFFDIASTGTALSLSDDGETMITTTVGNALFPAGPTTVANNGGILAGGGGNLPAGNSPLPVVGLPAALLPYWDDIDSGVGNVYWQEVSLGGVRTLIVQWDRRPLYPGQGAGTFQLQLFEAGPVLARFAYRDVDFGSADSFGAGATIGVQRGPGDAVQFSFDQASLANGDVVDIVSVSSDDHLLTLAAGDVVLLQTQTPLDGSPHDPANSIDPTIIVLAPDMTLVGERAGGAADGKNVQLMFVAPVAGQYTLRVTCAAGAGEYSMEYLINAPAPVAGDYDADRAVDGADFLRWQQSLGQIGAPGAGADGDLSGGVDGGDLAVWGANLGQSSDDFPDVAQQAAFLGAPAVVPAQIDEPGDVDAFAIAAVAGRKHRFQVDLNGATGIDVRLVGPDGSTEVAVDDDGGAALVEWTPTAAATYYVLVSGHAGEAGGYTLRALRDDHGNSAQTATLLTLSGVAAGAVEEPGDVDWFRFNAVAGRTYEFTSTPDELADVGLRLYAPNGFTLVADSGTGPAHLVFRPSNSGAYYLMVRSRGGNTGHYQITALQDDFGNTPATATAVSVPFVTVGAIDYPLDLDWISFAGQSGVRYTIETVLGTLGDSTLTLYGNNGATQLAFDDDSGTGLAALINWVAPNSGRFHVAVAGKGSLAGSYELRISRADDHGNSAGSATSVGVPSTTGGVVDTSTDSDWFSFAALAGVQYQLSTSLGSLPDSTLTLYDADGATILAFDDDGGAGLASLIIWTAPASGTYYVAAEGFDTSTGSYQLSIAAAAGVPSDPGKILSAVDLALGQLAAPREARGRALAELPRGGAAEAIDRALVALAGDRESTPSLGGRYRRI